MPKTWPPCDICGKPVSTAQGVLSIDKIQLDTAEENTQRWEEQHKGEGAHIVVEYRELLETYPTVAQWRWGHANCIPNGMYEVQAKRFNTLGKALDWTLHMMEKD